MISNLCGEIDLAIVWRDIASAFSVVGIWFFIDAIYLCLRQERLKCEILEIEKETMEREKEIKEKRLRYLEDFWDGSDK